MRETEFKKVKEGTLLSCLSYTDKTAAVAAVIRIKGYSLTLLYTSGFTRTWSKSHIKKYYSIAK